MEGAHGEKFECCLMVRDFLEEFGGILFSDGDLFLNEGFGEGEGAGLIFREDTRLFCNRKVSIYALGELVIER